MASFFPRLSSCALSVCVALGVAPCAVAQNGADLCALAPVALERASDIRGLRIKQPVPCLVQDKDAVKGFLDETIERDLPPQKLQMEQIAYRAIGMIPDDFDYGTQLVQFLVSQLGGYYDPKKKRFVMAAWLPALVQETVAVHELTHALQDQYYDLGALLDPTSDNSDRSMATSALVEGDASAVMVDNERRARGLAGIEKEGNIDMLVLQQVLGAGFASPTGGVPESLKAMLLFPYTSGLRFVHAVLRTGGYSAVGRAYSRSPSSTREILHPEEYLANSFTPNIPKAEELPGVTSDDRPVYTDVVGEFGISSLFSNESRTRQRAAQAAVGWVGDRVGVFSAREKRQRVSWLVRWESEQDAREFLDTYREYIEARYQVVLGGEVQVVTPTKSIRLTQRGAEVSIDITVTEP